MHHIWFLTIQLRTAIHADIPRHQPCHYPPRIRWLIWIAGLLGGGWINRNRDYGKLFKGLSGWRYRLLFPDTIIYFGPGRPYLRCWCPRKHFDWVLDAYGSPQSPQSPINTNDIPF